jgi:uncharacterized protein
MLLSKDDVARLEGQGFGKDFFVRFDSDGYALMRNRQGHCVFYNVEERQCDVYTFRPSGCRVYPVIYDEEKGIVIDSICHAQASITEQEKARKGKKVLKILENVDNEAISRRSKR